MCDSKRCDEFGFRKGAMAAEPFPASRSSKNLRATTSMLQRGRGKSQTRQGKKKERKERKKEKKKERQRAQRNKPRKHTCFAFLFIQKIFFCVGGILGPPCSAVHATCNECPHRIFFSFFFFSFFLFVFLPRAYSRHYLSQSCVHAPSTSFREFLGMGFFSEFPFYFI